MRYNLSVPYAEKDTAKALGARWDPAKKIWYVTDPADLSDFEAWLKEPVSATPKSSSSTAAAAKPKSASAGHQPVHMPCTDHSLPACGCTHVAPWIHCEHSVSR